MKHLSNIFLSFCFLSFCFLSSSCNRTSADCDCVPPPPQLEEGAEAWIKAYDDTNRLIYETEKGDLDTFKVERVWGEAFVGGPECGTYGDMRRAIIKSKSSGQKFTISALRNSEIEFNHHDSSIVYMWGVLNQEYGETDWMSYKFSGNYNLEDEYKGNPTVSLEVECDISSNCNHIAMQRFKVSREFGLLYFYDSDDTMWSLVD